MHQKSHSLEKMALICGDVAGDLVSCNTANGLLGVHFMSVMVLVYACQSFPRLQAMLNISLGTWEDCSQSKTSRS